MAETKTSFWKKFFNLLAFIALTMIGLALLIAYIFKSSSSISGPLRQIAEILSYLVVAFYAFFFALGTTRRSNKTLITLMSIWIVSVVLIIVFIILR